MGSGRRGVDDPPAGARAAVGQAPDKGRCGTAPFTSSGLGSKPKSPPIRASSRTVWSWPTAPYRFECAAGEVDAAADDRHGGVLPSQAQDGGRKFPQSQVDLITPVADGAEGVGDVRGGRSDSRTEPASHPEHLLEAVPELRLAPCRGAGEEVLCPTRMGDCVQRTVSVRQLQRLGPIRGAKRHRCFRHGVTPTSPAGIVTRQSDTVTDR